MISTSMLIVASASLLTAIISLLYVMACNNKQIKQNWPEQYVFFHSPHLVTGNCRADRVGKFHCNWLLVLPEKSKQIMKRWGLLIVLVFGFLIGVIIGTAAITVAIFASL